MLTLVGVGGIGKTRLALEVARSIVDGYPGGVSLVELGPLADAALVPRRVATVLDVHETADQPLASLLANRLDSRRFLLVVDNCEHLLQACAVLADALLRASANLQILATSREPIGIGGEVAWRVPSLRVPDPQHARSMVDVQQNPAVQLFIERARAAEPRFALTANNALAVAHICRRLEGIPLALELAAARVEALTPEQVAVRLDQRFRLLTGGDRAALPRQQTLLATMDWSYELLSEPERRLFERLAVFAGGWILEATEAIGAGGGLAPQDVLDLLEGLVRKSLVTATEGADATERYGLLETVREYAHQKLVARGIIETAAVRDRHAAFYACQAEQQDSLLSPTPGPPAGGAVATPMLHRLDAMHDNLFAALAWCLDAGRAIEGLSLAVTLGDFWWLRGTYAEGRRWLETMLDRADRTFPASSTVEGTAPALHSELRARALGLLGLMASRQGDYAQARICHEATVPLWRNVGNSAAVANALSWIGLDLWLAGDVERATALLNESLPLSRTAADGHTVTMTLRNLGMIARSQAQYECAAALFGEAADLARSLGWTHGHPYARAVAYQYARAVAHLGRVAYLQGDYRRARILLHEALRLVGESQLAGHRLADCLDWLAAVDGAQVRHAERRGCSALRNRSGGPAAGFATRLRGRPTSAMWRQCWLSWTRIRSRPPGPRVGR